jgi:hypothetical protein
MPIVSPQARGYDAEFVAQLPRRRPPFQAADRDVAARPRIIAPRPDRG